MRTRQLSTAIRLTVACVRVHIDEFGTSLWCYCPICTVHHLVADGSMPNRHPTESRTSVLIQMRDPEDRSLKPGPNGVDLFHNSRGQGMMLRGIDPTAQSGTAVEGGQGLSTSKL